MSVAAWTFLVLVVVALAAASVWRRRTSSRIGAPPRLPSASGDDLGSLGLSPVRPSSTSRPAARPVAPRDTPASEPALAESDAPPATWEDDGPSWTFDTSHGEATTDVADLPSGDAEADDRRPLDTVRTDDLVSDMDALLVTPAPDRDEVEALDAPSTADDSGITSDEPAPLVHAAPLTSARPAPAYVAPGSPLWVAPGPPEHLLASLAACIGGTVAVLRRDADGYVVDALAGIDLPGLPPPLAAEGLHTLDRAPLDRFLSVLDGDDLAALAYLPPGTARAALVRALDETPEPRVLVVVTLGVDADHVDPDTARLVGDYVDLLATLRADAPAPPPHDDEPSDAAETDLDAPDEAALGPLDDAASDDGAATARPPAALPRSVILTGEIAAARDGRRPLAFALVTRADADALLDDDARATEAEAELDARLRAAPRVRRVEPFGALVFGVFLDATPDQVAPWARALSGKGHALRVGAVAPAAGAADTVRAAATEALEAAYAEGAVCVVTD